MARKDTNGIGAGDLENTIKVMSRCPGWVEDAFSPQPNHIAVEGNVTIASNRSSKVLWACLQVFSLFIELAKSLNGGNLDTNTQQKWLLFQTLPLVLVNSTDPFSALQHLVPLYAGATTLESLLP